MTDFKWHRELVTQEIYKNSMEIPEDNKGQKSFEITVKDSDKDIDHKTITIPVELLDGLQGSKHLTAYNVASDIRKFEIGLFWHRAAFFWAFIVAIYTAYYHVHTEICKQQHGSFPLLVLSGLGLFFCFSWLLSSKGSRHWQENWENHLDLLENEITRPLYKTYLTGSYSESKIVIAAGWIVTVCSYGLLIYEFANMAERKFNGKGFVPFVCSLIFSLLIPLFLYAYSRLMLGNLSNDGEIEFELKKYGEI